MRQAQILISLTSRKTVVPPVVGSVHGVKCKVFWLQQAEQSLLTVLANCIQRISSFHVLAPPDFEIITKNVVF
jgi:hypothetical protein